MLMPIAEDHSQYFFVLNQLHPTSRTEQQANKNKELKKKLQVEKSVKSAFKLKYRNKLLMNAK